MFEVYLNGKYQDSFSTEKQAKEFFWYDISMSNGDVFEILDGRKIVFIAEKMRNGCIDIIRGSRW